jgi:uncharacterized protein
MNETAAVLPPLPDPTDPIFEPFWAGTRKERLVVPSCTSCSALQWPPRPVCRVCRAESFCWGPISPRGTLHTWLVASRAFHPGFKNDIPYIVGVVELEDGVRMLGRLVDVESSALSLGRPFEATFDQVSDEVTLVRWIPLSD